MPVNEYDIGDGRWLEARWTDPVTLAPIDPTTVTFTLTPPSGPAVTYVYGTDAQLIKVSAGYYRVFWTMAVAGEHTWKFVGTGAGPEARSRRFRVRA